MEEILARIPYDRGVNVVDLAEHFPDLTLKQIALACRKLSKQGRALPLYRCKAGQAQFWRRLV